MDTLDDITLAEKAGNDPLAFAALYRRYLKPLYGYLFNRLGSREETEDLVSQVFMEALEGLAGGRYRPTGSFAAWLFTIARRRSADFYRVRSASALTDLPSSEPGLPALWEEKEELHRLERLLAEMDGRSLELLRMRFSAGLTFAQMAEVQGRKEAAVKMALYRILEKIRQLWEVHDERATHQPH